MARPRNDDVRRAAIEATIDCIAANGVVGLSVREVARAAGVSTGTLSHHFGSKRKLLLEAIDFGYWQLPEWFGQRPAIDSMRYVLGRYELSTPRRRSWWRFWLAISAHGQVDEEIGALMLHEYRSVEDRWTNALGRGQREGVFAPGFDPRVQAVRLAALAHGVALAQLVGAMPVESAACELRAALDALIGPPPVGAARNQRTNPPSR